VVPVVVIITYQLAELADSHNRLEDNIQNLLAAISQSIITQTQNEN